MKPLRNSHTNDLPDASLSLSRTDQEAPDSEKPATPRPCKDNGAPASTHTRPQPCSTIALPLSLQVHSVRRGKRGKHKAAHLAYIGGLIHSGTPITGLTLQQISLLMGVSIYAVSRAARERHKQHEERQARERGAAQVAAAAQSLASVMPTPARVTVEIMATLGAE
jgi:hypothetical protein